MALEPCYLIYYQIVPLSSEPHAMSNKMNLCKLMVKRRRDWLPPSFLVASLLAPHNVLPSPWLKRKIRDCSQSITKYLIFSPSSFKFLDNALFVHIVWLRVFHCMFTATFHVCVLFCTDVSYVIGITYQTIDKSLISELLGGLQGMWFIEWCNVLLDKWMIKEQYK